MTNLEEAKTEFVREWNAGQNPTVQQYITAYPDHAVEITEFILDQVERSNAVNRGINRALKLIQEGKV